MGRSEVDWKEVVQCMKRVQEQIHNATEYATANQAYHGIDLSKECYEVVVGVPDGLWYVCMRNEKDNPAPNLYLIKDPTEEQKKEIMYAQAEFRDWLDKAYGYLKTDGSIESDVMRVVAYLDDHLEYRVYSDVGVLYCCFKKFESLTEFESWRKELDK